MADGQSEANESQIPPEMIGGLCFQHGGSELCEQRNMTFGKACPRCLAEEVCPNGTEVELKNLTEALGRFAQADEPQAAKKVAAVREAIRAENRERWAAAQKPECPVGLPPEPGEADVPGPQITYPSGATRSAEVEGIRYDLIPFVALRRLAARYGLGAERHGDRNWEGGAPASDTANHAIQHFYKWLAGDRSEDHLAAVAWGACALMYYEETVPSAIDTPQAWSNKQTGRTAVYIAGAYSADNVMEVLDNMRRGLLLAVQVLRAGYAPFAPWLDYQFALLDGELTIGDFYEYSITWMEKADVVLPQPVRLESSKGSQKELARARELGKPVVWSVEELRAAFPLPGKAQCSECG